LDDLALLRRIEDNVENLIEAHLFPLYHYKVGTDERPDVRGPDGLTEADKVRKVIKYMPASGIFVTDHRHEVTALGAEGKALNIEVYLNYFRSRVLAGLGTSMLDMGEGGAANKSTANTLSKGMLMDIESMTKQVASFIDFYVITELLIEGGFDPLNPDEMVHLKFGTIDKDEKRADENQQIQLWMANLRTMTEVRKSIGDTPWKEEYLEETFYKMFEEPNALLKSMGPGTAASETLGEHPSSNVSPEAVKKEKANAEKIAAKEAAIKGRPVSRGASASAKRTSSNRSRPANQHGRRSSPKTNRDLTIFTSDNTEINITCDFDPNEDKINEWEISVYDKWEELNKTIPLEIIAKTMLWRLK
jgi:hypothetical protein